MEKSEKFSFNLPSSNSDDIADINQISDNFRIIDENIPSKDELKSEIEKEKIIVDQVYDPESENAQSGIAVDEAIKQTNNIFSNALKGTKSGAAVVANDVSPIEHNTYVTLRNKNLWNKTYGANKSNWEILDDYYYVLPIKVGKGNIVTVSYKNELIGNGLGFFTAVMTERSSATSVTTWLYHNTNSSAYTKRVVTLTATEENIYIRTSIPSKGGLGSNAFAFFVEYINDTLQIELGTTETNYTPYLTDFSSVSVIKLQTIHSLMEMVILSLTETL